MTTRKPKVIAENLAEAERLIAECRETRSPVIRVDDLGLRRLPESVRNLTWLRELRADDNHLAEIPDWIDELRKLKGLYLSGNQLKTLPDTHRFFMTERAGQS